MLVKNVRLEIERDSALRSYDFMIAFDSEDGATYDICVSLTDNQIRGLTEQREHFEAIVGRVPQETCDG